MFERVARAIEEAHIDWERREADQQGVEPFCEALARAALQAIQHPTPAMRSSGARAIPAPGAHDIAHDCWDQMVNAALDRVITRTGLSRLA